MIATPLSWTGITEARPPPPQALQEVVDARQQSQIWTAYALNSRLRANDLKVSVRNGTATLSGKVDQDVSKQLAYQIAQGVIGVDTVDNQIVVQPGYIPLLKSSVRGYGDVVDDAMIIAEVRSKLLWSKYRSAREVQVSSKWGEVILIGVIDNAVAKRIVGRLALNTRGVVAVDNQLTIKSGGANALAAAQDDHDELPDNWITMKVKSTFLYSSNIQNRMISVSTSDGVVTLSGELGNDAQREAAVELATQIRGVRNVVLSNAVAQPSRMSDRTVARGVPQAAPQ